jgi:phosphopentomutase
MQRDRRAVILLLDGVGVGALPDAGAYGDEGANTVGHVDREAGGLRLPRLAAWGLGHLVPLRRHAPAGLSEASYGRMVEVSPGKDSSTGHWELCGVQLERPFPTYPDGFPPEVLQVVRECTGREMIGNVAASGTEIIERLGRDHLATGRPILYTSADSVLQIAAHIDVLSEEELYRICARIRESLVHPPHDVLRVIARPFEGEPGRFRRRPGRKDFSLPPPDETLMDRIRAEGGRVVGVGKVASLFGGRGFDESFASRDNEEGMRLTEQTLERGALNLLFTNLVDFDTLWGHRNDVAGFARGLEDFDRWFDGFLDRVPAGTLVLVTADHGNDPTHPGTDHTREHPPVMAAVAPRFEGGHDLGTRSTFSDVAATLAAFFEVSGRFPGRSFLDEIPAPG